MLLCNNEGKRKEKKKKNNQSFSRKSNKFFHFPTKYLINKCFSKISLFIEQIQKLISLKRNILCFPFASSQEEFSTKRPKPDSGKLIVGMVILLVVAFKLDSLKPRRIKKKRKKKKWDSRETRDAHRKENERRVVVEDERTDSLIALPFHRGAYARTRTDACVYAHPLLWMHTSRAVSTILKGSRRTFPARRNREQLTPRRLSIPFPQRFSLPSLFPPSHPLIPSISSPPVSAFHRRNQYGEYVYTRIYTRRAIRDRARARGGVRGGEDGRWKTKTATGGH